MAEKDKSSKAAVVVSIGAAVAATLALLQQRVKAEPSQIVGLDEATMNLLIAIAQASGNIDTDLDLVIDAINSLALEGGQGWPPNAEGARTFAVLCPAVATSYPVPDMEIPSGMSLAIKASPLNVPLSLLFVARTPAECTNPNSAWPLIPNESITYQVKNANAFFISTNIAGSIAIFSAEQRS